MFCEKAHKNEGAIFSDPACVMQDLKRNGSRELKLLQTPQQHAYTQQDRRSLCYCVVNKETNCPTMETDDPLLDLLDQAQAVIEVEKALTETLERVEPWLRGSSTSTSNPRVRPLPTSLEQAEQVLAVARNLASRTSAPAGWNPMAPVIGFSTPNPMPHQLRGGALATLQLERAKQAESDKKRIKLQQEQEKKTAVASKSEKGSEHGGPLDPKRVEIRDHKQTPPPPPEPQQRRASHPPQKVAKPKQQEVSMNLSDSESSEEEDSD